MYLKTFSTGYILLHFNKRHFEKAAQPETSDLQMSQYH